MATVSNGVVTAHSAGTTTVYCETVVGSLQSNSITVNVTAAAGSYAIDYINLTHLSDPTGPFTLSVTKFSSGDFYFQAFNDSKFGDLYSLTAENIDWLNSMYDAWSTNTGNLSIASVEYKAWMANVKLIAAIDRHGWNVTVPSDEFYGLWMHYTRLEVSLAEASQLIAQMAGTALIFGAVIYQTVVLIRSTTMLVNQKAAVSGAQYAQMELVAKNVPSNARITGFQSADVANADLAAKYPVPPYKPGTYTATFEVTGQTQYVRVTNKPLDPKGQWVMRASDIAGLTPQQIQSKFALDYIPTHVLDVTFSSGDMLRTGIANNIFGQPGGGVQFDLMEQFIGFFGPPRLLP